MPDDMPNIPGIKRSFDIEEKGDAWHLHCRICKRGWSLTKTSTAPGNILALLNHAAGCEKKAHARNRDQLNRFFGG